MCHLLDLGEESFVEVAAAFEARLRIDAAVDERLPLLLGTPPNTLPPLLSM
jgi:hypothetical protein